MAAIGCKAYHFGVLTSSVHMAWMRAVAGRLKSDYRYSAAVVYNNFPWPEGGFTTEHTETRFAGHRTHGRSDGPSACSVCRRRRLQCVLW